MPEHNLYGNLPNSDVDKKNYNKPNIATITESLNSIDMKRNDSRSRSDATVSAKCEVNGTTVGVSNNNLIDQKSHPIQVQDLLQVVKTMRQNGKMEIEFSQLIKGRRQSVSLKVADSAENKSKNRYNVKPYDFNRVVLQDSDSSDYINASYIDGALNQRAKYIAMQAPRPVTIADVWQMMWQENSNTIVMLTSLIENGKTQSERYWPEEIGASSQYGKWTVTLLQKDQYADFSVHTIELIHGETSGCRTVKHFHFESWPDKNVPQFAMPLIIFHHKIKAWHKDGPMVVHCSAGVGRTGTFIALDYLYEEAENKDIVDVFACVHKLRHQRMDMVQREIQYVFIYETLAYELTSLRSRRANNSRPKLEVDISSMYTNVSFAKGNPQSDEYKIMEKLKLSLQSTTTYIAGQSNANKNRRHDVLPGDNVRLMLMTIPPSSNNYINAVAVDSWCKRYAYVITQTPLRNTIADFWALVFDYKCSVVITMDTIDGSLKDCPIFWPQKAEQNQGSLSITPLSESHQQDLVTRFFHVSIFEEKMFEDGPFLVRQYHVNLSPDASFSDRLRIMSRLAVELDSVRITADQRILIHCRDGVKHSTPFCALLCAIEQLKIDQQEDVFTLVQCLRLYRPQAIETEKDYVLLLNLVNQHKSQQSTYCN